VSEEKNFFWFILVSFLSLMMICFLTFPDYKADSTRVLGEQTVDCSYTCSQVKEVYIPLGQGSTSSRSWEQITGAEAVINLANFSGVKSIVFEASLRIPTGNGRVYAKLYDVTAKHDAWFSEVSVEGSQSKREESAPIVLSSGRNLYRIKMKSTMGYEAFLDQARLKILLQ